MLVAVFGDCHGNLNLMYAKALAWQERTGQCLSWVFQVGDFGIWLDPEELDGPSAKHMAKDGLGPAGDFPAYATGKKHVPIPTLFIRGNHEDQSFLRYHELIHHKIWGGKAWNRSIEILPSLHYLPDGHVITLEGVGARVAGLGGNFAFKTWEQGLEYWKVEGRRLNHITRDRYERLIREEEITILMTHDGPSEIGLRGNPNIQLPKEEMTGAGVKQIRQLIQEKVRKYSFSGHWHEPIRTRIGRSQHTSLDKVSPGQDFSYPDDMVVIEL